MTIKAAKTNNANFGISVPKKEYDQSAFNTKFTPNKVYALFLSFLSSIIIKNKATPIKMYKIVHTTENTQPAGVNTETFNVSYHKFPPENIGVTINPKNPGTKDKNIAKIFL